MSTVRGFLKDKTAYEVTVEKGKVSGSTKVSRLLDLWAGQLVAAGPSGPLVAVSVDDPVSVMAMLGRETSVVAVDSDADPRTITGRRVQ